jgi:anthranilate/para-aminobenzoate synthase component II
VRRMIETRQWEQHELVLNNKIERLGFYNSFAPESRNPQSDFLATWVLWDAELVYPDSMYIQEGNISWFQFHPESVMSQNGYEILKNELIRIISHR